MLIVAALLAAGLTGAARADAQITVNSPSDVVDANPGDGVCETAARQRRVHATCRDHGSQPCSEWLGQHPRACIGGRVYAHNPGIRRGFLSNGGGILSTGSVTVTNRVLGVNIALGAQPSSACPAFEDAQGKVDIAQLIQGVRNALNGCGNSDAALG